MDTLNLDPYADNATADEYHGTRQSADLWLNLDEEDKARRLVSASDFIDACMRYQGKPANGNGRQFPRIIGGETVMPSEIVKACCELALLDDIAATVKSGGLREMAAGILLKSGSCDGGCSGGLGYIAALLSPFAERNRPLLRG